MALPQKGSLTKAFGVALTVGATVAAAALLGPAASAGIGAVAGAIGSSRAQQKNSPPKV